MADSKDEKFKKALENAKVPILILDNKWHRLFKKIGITKDIERLEKELTELIKRQGKINNEMKSLKKIKGNLMNEIVSSMEDNDSESSKKIKDNKILIEQANDKMNGYEDELLDLPMEIDRVNKELMLHTMELCYETLDENTNEIEEIAEWIKDIRIQLKKNVINKQEKEKQNSDLYVFMHNIFGHDAMNLFDMRYEPKIRVPENNEGTVSN